MDLKAQMEWAYAECEFIGGLLLEEGHSKVLRSCIDIGQPRLHEIAEASDELVREFFQKPRHARQSILDSFDTDRDRHAFLLVLMYTARCALFLQEKMEEQGILKAGREGKGKLLVRFAAVTKGMQDYLPALYPFAEDVPFGMPLDEYLEWSR